MDNEKLFDEIKALFDNVADGLMTSEEAAHRVIDILATHFESMIGGKDTSEESKS